ncbi:MAG: alpha/beta hydrolase, partial [Planctomycetota bacterium]
VVAQDPDWLFDLHEGYEFNVSHKPKPGKDKSVGSTIIYDRNQQIEPLVQRMLRAANATVSRPDRRFVPRTRGPIKSSLASAVINVLGKRAMILETTFNYQSLSIRTRQHRAMMAVALRMLEMVDRTPRQLQEFTLALDAEEAGIKNYVVPTLSDVYYGTHSRQVLDFWKADAREPTPVVFMIHGESWTTGSKVRVFDDIDVRRLLDEGLSVVSINYRFLHQAPRGNDHPPVRTPLYDAARALQFVRSNAGDWNLDATRIAGSGTSAGACAGLWLALHRDLAESNSRDPIARESTRLSCLAVSGAQTTLDPKQMQEWTPNIREGGKAFGFRTFEDFLVKRDSVLPWIREYSPYSHLTADDPPMALFYKHPTKLGRSQEIQTDASLSGVKMRELCRQNGVECYLHYAGMKDAKYTSTTDYLIERLTQQ